MRLARLSRLAPLAAAGTFYAWLWPHLTPDMTQSYAPWLRHVEVVGAISAIGHPFGDYTPPFVYLLAIAALGKGILTTASLVKLISVAGTVALALATRRLLRALAVSDADRWAAFVPLLPGVAFNAALMASADAWWAAPCVMALAAAVDRRHRAMLAWCGVALAVKQQAVCLAPAVLGLLLARQVPVRRWLFAPAAYLACFAPSFLAGAPLGSAVGIYARQAGFFDAIALNAPNIWSIAALLPAGPPLTGLALAAAIGASAWLAARIIILRPEGATLVATALASPLLVVGLLPRMHERYFFLADVLALVWSAVSATRRASTDAMLVQLGSTLGILAYMSGASGLAALGAVPMVVATARVIATLAPARAANDNALAFARR